VKTSNTRETLSSFLDLCGIDSDIFHARQVAAFRMFTLRESCIQIHEWYASRERQNAAIFVGFFYRDLVARVCLLRNIFRITPRE
jgi:hypothetical protein